MNNALLAPHRDAHLRRELIFRRLSPGGEVEGGARASNRVDAVIHVHREADRARVKQEFIEARMKKVRAAFNVTNYTTSVVTSGARRRRRLQTSNGIDINSHCNVSHSIIRTD